MACAKSLRPLHLRYLSCWRKSFANFAPHILGFSTDQCLFCIRECQVQIHDGISDSSIEIFVSFSVCKHQDISLWEPSIIASRLPVHTGFHMDFCACARSWTPRWCCAMSIDWGIFYHISTRRFVNWCFSPLLLVVFRAKPFFIVFVRITGSNLILFL